MPQKRLLSFLKENNVPFTMTRHPKAYTAQRIAASAHIKGNIMSKTIVVKIDGSFALAVLPANDRIALIEFAKQLHVNKVEIASEEEFRELFPDCETGGMPPFGNLYDLKTYVAFDLSKNEKIAFNACNHIDIITMLFEDYNRLVDPIIVHFELN